MSVPPSRMLLRAFNLRDAKLALDRPDNLLPYMANNELM